MALESFYKNTNYTQDVLQSNSGLCQISLLEISSDNVMKDDIPSDVETVLFQNVQKLYENMKQITVKLDGSMYTFEIAYLQQGDGVDSELTISTYSSSLDNAGNAFELGLAAYLHPNRSYTYVASSGNGGSSALSNHEDSLTQEKERMYYARNGTLLVHEDASVQPLPTVRALHIALESLGIEPTRISSNSAGAILATAYGSAYGKDITTLHQNVRTNIFDITTLQLIKGMLYVESFINGPRQTKETLDPLSVPNWNAQTNEIKAAYYPKNITPIKSKRMMISNAKAFTNGPDNGDPMLHDLTSFARRNPGSSILFTNGEIDPLLGKNDYYARMGHVAVELSKITAGTVSAALIKEVSHGPHTFYPQFLHALVDQI